MIKMYVFSPIKHPVPATVLFFNNTAPTEIYTLSLHDALPISGAPTDLPSHRAASPRQTTSPIPSTHRRRIARSEEHTSELQSPDHLVCRLLLEKKKIEKNIAKIRDSIISFLSWR